MSFKKQKFILLTLMLLGFSFTRAQSFSDSLEQRTIKAAGDGRVVDNLNNSFSKNPKGEFLLAPENKDLKFAILIYNIDLLPDHAVFSAGMAFRDPKSNQLIAFRADHIVFSNKTGLTGPAKLYLVSDVKINLGQAADITIFNGAASTFANFECKGLTEFGVKGKVDFNPKFILPVDANGHTIDNKKLSSNFQLIAKSWSDMVVQVSINPFQIKGLNNYVFNISNATMDLSEASNATTMHFPEKYNTEEILGNQPQVWEGFYLEKGSVTLPEHFKKQNKGRVELGVNHLLIDEFGFSGGVFANNVLSFDEGQIGGWTFSIDYFEISLLMNHLVGGSMSGGLGLPILPDTTKLGYNAYINTNDNYGMMVSTRGNLTIPAFKVAKLTLAPNSYVDMEINDGELNLKAQLNGVFSIESKGNQPGENSKFQFPSIAFQGFRVSNKAPKIDIDYLGIQNNASPSDFSKYPLNIDNIYLLKSGEEKTIGIDFRLNLMENISVKTGLFIVGAQQTINNKDKFLFKRLEINDIEINNAISCFVLNGRIKFIKEDPTFGNGFNGNIKFSISKPKIEASAGVLFGNINNHRYWYFDASVIWDKPGIPFLPGAEINGFMGGAWQGMREANSKDNISNPQYGLTSIGKLYIPDLKAGLGLRAGIYIKSTGGSSGNNAFVAKTILEMQFNNNHGLNTLSIFGNVDVMTKNTLVSNSDLKASISNVPNGNNWETYKSNYSPVGNISGPFRLDFDFNNKLYQANFAVYIQGIAQNKIIGIGPKGIAGEISVLFSQNTWHFWIGTPLQPIGVKMNLGKAGDAKIGAYFMAGKEVKPAEPLPTEITNILGNQNADAMRQLNEMASGNAFAFGSRLYIQVGSEGSEKNVSIYASLRAIIGFDINVANYGKNSFCEGFNGPPGINGWFANGQLFAFLQGKVGASFKTKVISGKVDLLTLTTAAQLYCQGPNPFYSNGTAYIQVNIAGIINTKMKLNFALGEPCNLQKSSFTDTNIILTTNPLDNEINVSTLTPIKANFSVPINKPFKDADGKDVVFRLVRFEVSENGKNIGGRMSWNTEQNEIKYEPINLLPGKKKINILIYVEASEIISNYELQNSNGIKIPIPSQEKNTYDTEVSKMKLLNLNQSSFGKGRNIVKIENYKPILFKGKKVDELKIINFTTSAAPNGIPINNISFAYPIPSQLNSYKDQTSKGIMQLITAQDYLFNLPNTKTMAIFIDSKGLILSESIVNIIGKSLSYSIPKNLLNLNSIYQIYIKRYDIKSPTEVGKNINSSSIGSAGSMPTGAGTTISSTTTGPKAPVIYPLDLLLISYSFGTSNYPTFENKITNLTLNSTNTKNGILGEVLTFKLSNSKNEYFDFSELVNNPSIKTEVSEIGSPWYSNEAKKVYSIFKTKEIEILKDVFLNRDTLTLGLIPLKAIKIIENNADKMTLNYNVKGQFSFKPVYSGQEIAIENYFADVAQSDLADIKSSLIKYVHSHTLINTVELNKYIFSMNSTKSSSNQNGPLLPGGALNPGMISGPDAISQNISISAINTPAIMAYDNNAKNVSVPPEINSQNNPWIVKISKLQLKPIYPKSPYPTLFYYFLPGDKKYNSAIIYNQTFSGK